MDVVINEIFNVGLTAQKPDQLVNNALHKNFFGGEQWKPLGQIKTHHSAEDTFQGNAAIKLMLFMASVHDVLEKIKILVLGVFFGLCWHIIPFFLVAPCRSSFLR